MLKELRKNIKMLGYACAAPPPANPISQRLINLLFYPSTSSGVQVLGCALRTVLSTLSPGIFILTVMQAGGDATSYENAGTAFS